MADFLRSEITPVNDYRAELGETPVWCDRSQSLLWVDINRQRLLRYWPSRRETEIRNLPSVTSAVLLTDKEEVFLLAAHQGIAAYDYASGEITVLCAYPEETSKTRPNEAAIAPDGSLWFGTMDLTEGEPIGAWYRFAAGDAAPEKMMDNLTIPNTLVWHENRVWFADSHAKRFYSGNGKRINPRTLSCYSSGDLTPDGSTLTTGGRLINACFGHHCLFTYQLNEGELLAEEAIPLPVTQPSCCTFGGPERKTLFITSARKGLENPGPLEGALLQVETRETGMPQHRFILPG
ncbi:SMP-30/gluconolactonase/LRE family protein [Chimaeribacter arupi]|uniref:Gluconolaconase n=1 Tax=Chimaeribacter arupi TaxID=2060066 RepID=A0A2N5ERS9_9GAMM|nr:SMP-30/gluconolactonase/LRE family protein [Chimaeribacter arupi]MDV5138762.1 SMP-30/gluconolactonase/LRE family protein [Chimaeribacter arupi]PLR52534.1 gluconolaconase [Chimaeribacter arupi]